MKNLNEGITFDILKDSFEFNFESNNGNCIIEFDDLPLEPVQIGINDIYYFGYQFLNNDYATSQIRKKFFNHLKSNNNLIPEEIKHKFIMNALNKLHKQINLYTFDTVICPQSRSELNQKLLEIIHKTVPVNHYLKLELLKNNPENIKFDYDAWENMIAEKEQNGIKVFVNKAAYLNALKSIENLMSKIHSANYFSIAETVKNNKYKRFIENYLIFKNSDLEYVRFAKNILLIDDVATSGSTIFDCIKAIRCLNISAKIIIFTIVGKKDIGYN